MAKETALIVGAGSGLSASLARLFAKEGMAVALAGRSPGKLDALVAETGARAYRCNVSDPDDVAALFTAVDKDLGEPDVVVFNPSARVRGPIQDLDPIAVRDALMVAPYGGFLVAQQAVNRMLPKGKGTLLVTGASAAVKGYANSSCFAMGKFGLRGLCQSLARELQPKGINVAHFVIDGGIAGPNYSYASRGPDAFLEPDAIAQSYLHVLRQHRSAWSWEIELRPWVETL